MPREARGGERCAASAAELAGGSAARRLDGFEIDDLAWICLGVPVGLAYFTRDRSGTITAHYPNPAGTAIAELDPACWALLATDPRVAGMAAGAEALLVDRLREPAEHWLLPAADCHRLGALVRAHWRGPDGGPELRDRLERFFARRR